MGRVKGSTADATAARRAQGRRTKERILRAAYDAIAELGYQRATMTVIAERAEVSVQTVYLVFGTKPALLRALIASAVMGFTRPERPEDTTWFRDALVADDPAAALRGFVDGSRGIYRRTSIVSEAARVAAASDAEVAAIEEESELLRARQFRRVIQSLADRGALRADLDVDRGTDELLLLASGPVYLYLTRDRAWSEDAWASWLADALVRQLLEPEAERHPPRHDPAAS